MNQCTETAEFEQRLSLMQETVAKGKINLALLWPEYGGNTTSVNDLVLELDRERFNAIFIFLSGHGIEKNPIEEAGYKVFYLSNIELINAFRFSILFKLIRILKDHKTDVLHCHVHKPTVYGVLAAMFARTSVVLSHVHGLGRSRNLTRRLTNFLLSRRCSRIIAVANCVREDVLRNNWRLPAERVAVLENSVDCERFAGVSVDKIEARRILGVSPDAFVFGTVGRLAPTKGLSYLMRAFARAKEEIPSAELVLLGDGPSRAQLEQQALQMSCRDSIHFPGYRDNIEHLYGAMHVFVLSSVAEGMPRAILEAMAARVPCIATEVGGIPEIIDSSDIGLMVPARDENALARAMITLANQPEQKRKALVEKASERVHARFNHDIVKEKLANIYQMEMNGYRESRRRK